MSVFKMYFKLVRAVSAGFMWFAPCDAAFKANFWAAKKLEQGAVVKVLA